MPSGGQSNPYFTNIDALGACILIQSTKMVIFLRVVDNLHRHGRLMGNYLCFINDFAITVSAAGGSSSFLYSLSGLSLLYTVLLKLQLSEICLFQMKE